MANMFATPTIAQIKVTILGIDPPVWRRLLVPRMTTLAELHHIIQAAFGWLDYHLHAFQIGGLRYGDAHLLNQDRFADDSRALSGAGVRLLDFARGAPPFVYVYDFGDDWHHEVRFEAQLPAEPGRKYPACTDGARSRPPEDVGGVDGYQSFLKTWSDPEDPEYGETRRWAGRAFNPEKFDRDKTDHAIRAVYRSARKAQIRPA